MTRGALFALCWLCLAVYAPFAQAAPPAAAPQVATGEAVRSDIPSLLMAPDDINAIRGAQAVFKRFSEGLASEAESEEDFLKKLEILAKPKEQLTSYTYPQFFLSSIIYRSPVDWSMWINGQKISQDNKNPIAGLMVIDIEKEKATFKWRPDNMERVVDIGEGGPDNPVNVDVAGGVVTFTLRANQTFSAYAMRVLEGHPAPVMIDLTLPVTPSDAPTPAGAAGALKAPRTKDEKNGIGALIGAYESIGDKKPEEHTP